VLPACNVKCRTLSRTLPSHIVRSIFSASSNGIAYSNSSRTNPCLRLLSAIVATPSAIRTLALCPLLFAISPSRIRMLRTIECFHPSLATKNFRSISSATLAPHPFVIADFARRTDLVSRRAPHGLRLHGEEGKGKGSARGSGGTGSGALSAEQAGLRPEGSIAT
jgi:hypothetical protein